MLSEETLPGMIKSKQTQTSNLAILSLWGHPMDFLFQDQNFPIFSFVFIVKNKLRPMLKKTAYIKMYKFK